MQIKKDNLENIKKEYLKDKINNIRRGALNKTKISDLVRVGERSKDTTNNFSINIETLPVSNQKKSGRCWIFAGCNILREKIAKKYNLENFELSQNYIAFYDKLEKCNYFMESIVGLLDKDIDDRLFSFILTRGIEDGGQWDMFVNIIDKYGVAPKDIYPETYQSENTNEIDNILNTYLRKFTSTVKKLYIDNKNEEIKLLREKSIKEIYRLLSNCFGTPPTNFDFEFTDKENNYNIIKDITPKEFLIDFIEFNSDDYISIINSPTKDKPFNKMYTVKYLGNVIEGRKVTYLNVDINRFKELAISQLSNNVPVWFGSDCSKYGDRKEGIWDDLSYNEEDLLQVDLKMSKEESLNFRDSAMNHAMVLTGASLDNDKPIRWKIQNSWGDEIAYKGYFIATDTWFTNYVYQIVINKKYLNEEELKILNTGSIELEPWDPMGTLA